MKAWLLHLGVLGGILTMVLLAHAGETRPPRQPPNLTIGTDLATTYRVSDGARFVESVAPVIDLSYTLGDASHRWHALSLGSKDAPGELRGFVLYRGSELANVEDVIRINRDSALWHGVGAFVGCLIAMLGASVVRWLRRRAWLARQNKGQSQGPYRDGDAQ